MPGDPSVGAGLKPAPTKFHALPEIVRAFKTFAARAMNNHQRSHGTSLWQRNYYEHIIRDEKDLDRIRRYIAENPARWAEDCNNPAVWDRPQSGIKGRVQNLRQCEAGNKNWALRIVLVKAEAQFK